jgi:hypothetical protein
MSDSLGEAVYGLLTGVAEDFAEPFDVYVAGEAPAIASAPFVTYQRSGATAGRMTTTAQLGLRRLQIDVYAPRPSLAEEIADAVELAMGGLSAATGPASVALEGGFDRAEGTYRITDYPEVLDDGSRIYRVILTFEQREQLAI